MASIPSKRIAVGGGADAQQESLLIFLLFVLFIIIYSMLTPYPPSSLVLSNSTTGRSMITLRMTRPTTATTTMTPTMKMADAKGKMATTG